ncbi:DNA repair protein RecN [Acetobacter cibinongensis]|uniref:DNA repair protein RecN n=1 Tax=Acetobacter cibinongensis TaxID=146475 RepID=A0A0D6N2X2_9PROT|nr:DNA repair protein RecN [Acetobacter cibinongensis]GAN59923.1 DNA repair protein RecN [Acetobacter cibinongensis]GBQ16348.1 DNA repair protein RecN [Acetobacter cibinongensis NRIC 0482]GEL57543.1 DNA repair protein RecN [Acetobacter cibinongensis]
MLTNLSIRDVVLIEALDLSLHTGFTALTGETGAGKSILLDSLGLALGERASAGLVRSGADEARVTASFDVPLAHPAYPLLAEQGIATEPGEPLMLRRIISKEGRSRAWINDQAVGITLMRRIAVTLVEIQGQHEQMGLADSSTHRGLLDAYGVSPSLLTAVTRAYANWHKLSAELSAARKALQEAAREEDWLRHTVAELTTLAPQPGEEDLLAQQRHALQQAERRGEAISAALSELNPRDRRNSGPAAALRGASRALQRLLPAPTSPDSGPDPLEARTTEALAALESAENALAEAETLLSRLADESEANPRLLEDAEERLFTLRAAARKHDVTVDDLPGLLEQLSSRLTALESGATHLEALQNAVQEARTAYEDAGARLSTAREKAARKLEQAVTKELKPIKLERARFLVDIAPLPPEQWSAQGMEQLTFLIAANPGQPPGPLAKVASGGELSRLMLALKLVLAEQSAIGTIVFDEIDAGVGGATAAAIGERLHRLAARSVQVLAVTHSPQVAASADAHLRIGKIVRNGNTATHAAPLSAEERQEEIARMLAGDTITDAARAAAASLLGQKND